MTTPTLKGGTPGSLLDHIRRCDSELMLNTAYEFDGERPVPPDPTRAEAHHDTCIYFGAPDVNAVYWEFARRASR